MRHIIATIVLGLTISIAGAKTPTASNVLSTLDKSHPRLMLKDAGLKKLKALCKTDKALQKCVADTIKYADSCLKKSPLVYKKIGPRLLGVSRDCLRRTYALSLAWRWTGEKKYADQAIKNLLAVCAFKNWNPSHYLDTAEMSHAVGLGYDWLYPQIDEATG
ncbi:MAG: heparinase, partial [Phycisphaerales bacterium]|nr:heparinase [Phycisphaerales bacterium]